MLPSVLLARKYGLSFSNHGYLSFNASFLTPFGLCLSYCKCLIYDRVLTWGLFLDFNQGVGSLLSVRGQGILSWIGDNNFIVEDRATTSHEVLHCLIFSFYILSEE